MVLPSLFDAPTALVICLVISTVTSAYESKLFIEAAPLLWS